MTESLDRPPTAPPDSREAIAALQSLRFGGGDLTTHSLAVSPTARAALSPLASALRWGALLFGMVFAAPAAFDGELDVVASLALALWWSCWRSFRPLPLAKPDVRVQTFAVVDGVVFGVAAGISGGPVSPFALTITGAAVLATVGWGIRLGSLTWAAGIGAAVVVSALVSSSPELGSQQALTVIASGTAAVGLVWLFREWLIEAERRRRQLSRRVESLTETNDLLVLLTEAARTIPDALDRQDVVAMALAQLQAGFSPSSILLLEEVSAENWVTAVSENSSAPLTIPTGALPTVVQRAIGLDQVVAAGRCEMLNPRADAVLAAPLVARERLIGAVVLGREGEVGWTPRDHRLLEELAALISLSFDNVRRYGQLQAIGANSERERIARDLHDRLGQLLTYIALELERMQTTEPTPGLAALQADVHHSIDELRDTLRQLRTNVSAERGFVELAAEVIQDFGSRHPLTTTFDATRAPDPLPLGVEQELLRILQESLANVAKHARATRVDVTYAAADGVARLSIVDDGQGFDLGAPRRSDAYGLTGIYERAAAIDATVRVESSPMAGTRIHIEKEIR